MEPRTWRLRSIPVSSGRLYRTQRMRTHGMLLLALCTAVAPLAGQNRDARVEAAVRRVTDGIVEIRHHLHQNPELGNREFETATLVAERLRALGLDEVRTGIAHTGVIGVLRGGRPGPVVAVRADMDALPVTEDTPYPFKSRVRATYLGQEVGVSHACGHDVHVAVQLGVAEVLAGMRAELPGAVLFIFQPAEEGPPPGEKGGAALMLEEGAFANPRPSAVFGLHTQASLDVGVVGYTPGPALAAADHFWITVKGRQAHGASPELSVDPVVTAAQVVLALQTVRSRTLPPLEPSVVTVGMIHGGERFNIIPAEVRLEGTVRTYSTAAQELAERRIREIVAGVTAAAGASFEITYERGSPPVVNDLALTDRIVPTLRRVLGDGNVRRIDPAMVGEDFSYFANQVPGFFYRLGVQKPGTTSGDHHTPTFQADDSAIPVGIRVMTAVLLDYLGDRR
jgi:amidohydrolase